MKEALYQKERAVLCQARGALDTMIPNDGDYYAVFDNLANQFEKLLRQSTRMMSMGDRIQSSLNRLNRELAASESKYRGVFENVTEGIFRCDGRGRFIEVNPAMASMFGFREPSGFLAGVADMRTLFCDESDAAWYAGVVENSGSARREVEVSTCGGNCLWTELGISVIGTEAGDEMVVGVLADVTERRQMLEEMCRLARTDALTGLWNRGYLMELADREVMRNERSGHGLAVLLLDVDYFKAVNDTHGHDVGDAALIGLAEVLCGSLREVDVVGRYGGEEFVVVLPDTPMEQGCHAAERIGARVREHGFECCGVTLPLTVSIGMAGMLPGDTLDSLLKYADIALYGAKKNGRDRVEVYRRGCHCSSANEGTGKA